MERETVYLRMEKVIPLPKLSFTNAERLGKFTTFSTFSHILKTSLCQFHHWYNIGYRQFNFSSIMKKIFNDNDDDINNSSTITRAFVFVFVFFAIYRRLLHTFSLLESTALPKEPWHLHFTDRQSEGSCTLSDKAKKADLLISHLGSFHYTLCAWTWKYQ